VLEHGDDHKGDGDKEAFNDEGLVDINIDYDIDNDS